MVIEPRIDAPVTGQAQVHRSQLADPQGLEVVFDAFAQLGRFVEPEDGAANGRRVASHRTLTA